MLTELDAFHGSGNRFDQFDHRKNGFSGAGSMSFGYGSYFTNDQVIAQSYADSLSKQTIHNNGRGIIDVYEYALPIIGRERAIVLRRTMSQLATYQHRIGEELTTEKLLDHLNWCKEQFKAFFNYDKMSNAEINSFRMSCYDYKFYFVFNESDKLSIIKSRKNLMFNDNPDKYNDDYQLFSHYYNIIVDLIKFINENKEQVAIERRMYRYTSYVYKVVIPDNDGTNYIDWYEPVSQDIRNKIINGIQSLYNNHSRFNKGRFARWMYSLSNDKKDRMKNDERWKRQLDRIINWVSQDDLSGMRLYDGLIYIAQDVSRESQRLAPRWASTFLRQCGIVGITYPSGTIWKKPDGSKGDARNYVIFDKRDIKITKVDENIKDEYEDF